MRMLRIVTLGLARGDRKCSLTDGQTPFLCGGYNPGEGNRRASRNGRVEPPPIAVFCLVRAR
jgi:hypothetical protein